MLQRIFNIFGKKSIPESIIAQQEIQEYIKEKKEIYDNLKKFLESIENTEQDFENLIKIISEQKQEETQAALTKFLQLIANIGNNCHRDESLFKKIFKLIEYYTEQIKQTFSNNEIFNIFGSNKKILLFLFKNKIITIDDTIYNEILFKREPNGNCYSHFFYPEIKNFSNEEKVAIIEKELFEKNPNIFDCFEEKREEGENDSFICSLIRKDSVEEFIEYINRKNISVNSELINSIFETNNFLNENENTVLIEYAAFFGSIQIFRYLLQNDAELKPSLWLYAIHSRNPELIHVLEEQKVDLPNDNYEKLFCESIKCHHNEIADYIESNYLTPNNEETRRKQEVLNSIIHFNNYEYFPSDLEDGDEFYYLCRNNFNKLVTLFIKKKEESIKKMISKNIIKLYLFIKSLYNKQQMKIKLILSIIYY